MKTIVESKNLKIDDSLPNQVVTDASLNLRDTDPVSTVINQVTDKTTKITSDETLNKYDIKQFLSEIFDVNQKLNELKIKLSFEIKDSVLNISKLIVQNSPKSLQALSKILEDIVSDGVLNYNDIPKLILLISTLHNTEFSKLDSFKGVTQKDVIEFIKFLIHAMIELELVQANDKKKTFEMVDISLNLLETSISVTDVISAVKSNCLPLNWSVCSKKINNQKVADLVKNVDTTKLVTVISTADDVATNMTRGETRGATIVNEVVVKADAKSCWSWPRK
jgi:hypothetical protein